MTYEIKDSNWQLKKLKVVGFAAALLCVGSTSHAAVFTVDNTQNSGSVFLQACTSAPNDCSFIGAVAAANATPAEDTIGTI